MLLTVVVQKLSKCDILFKMSLEEEAIVGQSKRKRGQRNEFMYKRNVIKKGRVKGIAYIDWKGNYQPGTSQGDDCK